MALRARRVRPITNVAPVAISVSDTVKPVDAVLPVPLTLPVQMDIAVLVSPKTPAFSIFRNNVFAGITSARSNRL